MAFQLATPFARRGRLQPNWSVTASTSLTPVCNGHPLYLSASREGCNNQSNNAAALHAFSINPHTSGWGSYGHLISSSDSSHPHGEEVW